jgi:hypothetical protein
MNPPTSVMTQAVVTSIAALAFAAANALRRSCASEPRIATK